MLYPTLHRYLPRHAPGTGPTSKQYAAVRAELTLLSAEVARLVKELQVQFKRIAELQQDVDQIKRVLKKLPTEP
jgi:chromosome segregation ATPase